MRLRKPSSDNTVILFGDSHAMQWFPALEELAKKRDWRLIGLTKSACPPARVTIYNGSLRREYRECDEWRERTLDRIADEEPGLIVTSTLTTYGPREDGEGLRGAAKTAAFEEGYVSTLKELRDTGAPVAVIQDVPHPDGDVPECVSRSMEYLERCAIPKDEAFDYPPTNVRAAEQVEGASLVDPTPVLCLEERCPAVVGDVLVYRNGAHLTRTYVRSLVPWLGGQLPEPTG